MSNFHRVTSTGRYYNTPEREALWDRLTAEERLLPKYKILRKMMKDHEKRKKE